ncbi:unnamed protein product [Closterium sp. Yama58-4]|nr:unnamed protein product [Closterium sp. Yama58-4]
MLENKRESRTLRVRITRYPPLDPSIRFLTYEWLDEPGGLADSLTGLATAFACALLTRRAFILRHPLLPLAFAPNLIDWSFSPDIPVEPARRIVVKRGVLFVEPEEFFALLDRALNVRLSWNRGLLTYWLAQAVDKKWSDRLKAMAMRPPYAFGCILRFLLKPQPDVIAKAEAMYHSLLSTPAPSSPLRQPHSAAAGHSGASDGASSHRVAVVGIHLRANDTFVWEGKEGFGEPKVLSDRERGVLMAWAESYMACAEKLEFWWMPPPTSVRWLVISNSRQLKEDLKRKYPHKVVASDILPVHANTLKSTIHIVAPFGINGCSSSIILWVFS